MCATSVVDQNLLCLDPDTDLDPGYVHTTDPDSDPARNQNRIQINWDLDPTKIVRKIKILNFLQLLKRYSGTEVPFSTSFRVSIYGLRHNLYLKHK